MSLNIVGAIIVGISLIVGAISTIIIKKKDNVVEQIAEQIIEANTGIDIDFTPEDNKPPKEVSNGNKKLDK